MRSFMLDIYSTVFQIPVYNGSYGITRDRSYWCRGTKEQTITINFIRSAIFQVVNDRLSHIMKKWQYLWTAILSTLNINLLFTPINVA